MTRKEQGDACCEKRKYGKAIAEYTEAIRLGSDEVWIYDEVRRNGG